MLCSNCHKNMAVIFTKKIDGDKSSMEGLCYNCAKEKGINPLEVLAKQANLSEDELNDMSKQFENLFGDIAQNIDIENINPENMSEDGGIPLGSIFSNMFGDNSSTGKETESDSSGKRKVKTEKRGKTKMTKQQNTFETPDFAFPQTVSDNAEHKLSQALEKGESVEALRAAMQMTIARDLVSNDNYKKGIELFDSLSKKLPAPYSQLAALLEARLYADIYNSSRWTYNNRTLPLSPVPADVTAWSRDIFSAKILSLIHI